MFFALLREIKLTRCFRVNAPLRGIKKIAEYQENIFSIFGHILNTIEDGALIREEGMGVYVCSSDLCVPLRLSER